MHALLYEIHNTLLYTLHKIYTIILIHFMLYTKGICTQNCMRHFHATCTTKIAQKFGQRPCILQS